MIFCDEMGNFFCAASAFAKMTRIIFRAAGALVKPHESA